jgi:hypothetical protein
MPIAGEAGDGGRDATLAAAKVLYGEFAFDPAREHAVAGA